MNLEQRLSELEGTVMHQAEELMAMGILLKAMIASHPSPSSLHFALKSLSANFADQAREHAFSTGRKPQVPEAIVSAVHREIAGWLQILTGAK